MVTEAPERRIQVRYARQVMTDFAAANWRTSSFCANSTCVQVAKSSEGFVVVRDSKSDDGPVLMYTAQEFRDFVRGVKAGEFDDLY